MRVFFVFLDIYIYIYIYVKNKIDSLTDVYGTKQELSCYVQARTLLVHGRGVTVDTFCS